MFKISRKAAGRIDVGVNIFYGILIAFVATVYQPTSRPDVLYFFKSLILTILIAIQTIDFNQFKNYRIPAEDKTAFRILTQYLSKAFVKFNLLLYLSVGLIINFFIFNNSIQLYFDHLIGLMLAQLYIGLLSVIYFLGYEIKTDAYRSHESKPHNPKFTLLALTPFMICIVLITPVFGLENMNHAAILPPVYNLLAYHPNPVLFKILNMSFLAGLGITAWFLLKNHLKKYASKNRF